MLRHIFDKIKGKKIPPFSKKLMRLSLIFSCVILAAALMIEVAAGELTAGTYEAHYLAAELYRLPCGILLFGWLAAFSIRS